MKYDFVEIEKSPVVFKENKRTAEAVRPSAIQLKTNDSITVLTIAVIISFLVIAIGGEQLVRFMGWF